MKVAVTILVLNQDDMVLLGRRLILTKAEYCSISGYIEADETILAAAQRHVHQEIGVEISHQQLKLFAIMHETSEQKIIFDFVLHVNADEIITSETTESEGWEWHVWESLPKPLQDATKDSLHLYQNFLKKRQVILA